MVAYVSADLETAEARRWYDSPEYRGPKAPRVRTARTNVAFAEGV